MYDKDRFSSDDEMGDAEIDIKPLVQAAKGQERGAGSSSSGAGSSSSGGSNRQQLGICKAAPDNQLRMDSVIWLEEGQVRQKMMVRLKNVERGEIEMELECVPLTQ